MLNNFYCFRNEIRSRTSSFVDDISNRAHDNLSSSASSITSGTPSTDVRLSQFNLESSVTSGTPSTEARLSHFALEKVYAHFGEDEEEESRPARTYSVGSKPEYTKSQQRGGVDKGPLENLRNSRTRAFSLGSKARHPTSAAIAERNEKKMRKAASTEKSTSFPQLNRGSSEKVDNDDDDNLMEIDFSNNRNRRPTTISTSSNKSTNPMQSPRSPTVSDYMEMSTPSTWKSEGSTIMTNQLELEKNAKNSLKKEPAPYMEMDGSYESSRTSSQPIAITAKKTAHSGAEDDFTQHTANSVDNGQHMIFSLSLENKTDDCLKLMEQSIEAAHVKTPPTEPLVSPLTPTIIMAAAKAETPNANSDIFQTANTNIANSPGGEYTMIAPPIYRSNIQHNYVELDFPQEIQSVPFRKGCMNTPKPLYTQVMFNPPATTATAPAGLTTATTTKSSKNNKNNKKK